MDSSIVVIMYPDQISAQDVEFVIMKTCSFNMQRFFSSCKNLIFLLFFFLKT